LKQGILAGVLTGIWAFTNPGVLIPSTLVSAMVLSQEKRSHIPEMIAQLNLSSDQKKKLETVYEEQAKQVQALKENTALSEDDRRAKLRDINQAANKQLSETLTSGQIEKLKELRKARQQKP